MAQNPADSIRRTVPQRTLGQQVYGQLQETILNGHLLPGTKLTLRGLATSLNTSIQPVREAVVRLAADGALHATPNRSILVPVLTRAELDDLHSARVLVEGEAAARFAERASEEDVAILSRINEDLRLAYDSTDVVKIVTSIQSWGLRIAQGSSSGVLQSAIFTLRLRLGPHLAEAMSVPVALDPDFLHFTVHINHEMVLAFRDRDPVRARDLRRADILTFQRDLYQRLGLTHRALVAG